jgi:hypothetical protein
VPPSLLARAFQHHSGQAVAVFLAPAARASAGLLKKGLLSKIKHIARFSCSQHVILLAVLKIHSIKMGFNKAHFFLLDGLKAD